MLGVSSWLKLRNGPNMPQQFEQASFHPLTGSSYAEKNKEFNQIDARSRMVRA